LQQDIKILTHSWISYFLEAYNYALPYLIDSFIEFYGEEYRNYITETIKSIKLDFIINASALKVRNYPKFMKKDITNIRKYLEEVTRYLNTLKHKLPKEELDSECSKCIVIKTDDTKKTTIILEKELNTTNYKVIDDTEIRLYDYLEHTDKVNKALAKNDINIMGLYETGITLEDYFKSVIKEVE